MIRSKYTSVIIIIGLIVLMILVVSMSIILIMNRNKVNSLDHKYIDSSTYQAIFLDNDQIYFGRLKNVDPDSEYLLLTDVYYVKVNEDSVGQLVKLGQIEPHRPTNEMIINRDHILFWENLTPESQVTQTIRGSQ